MVVSLCEGIGRAEESGRLPPECGHRAVLDGRGKVAREHY